MPFIKFKELKVKHGTYKASDGSDKPAWSTVGRIMHETDEDRYSVYINPERIAEAMSYLTKDSYGYIRLSAFDPRNDPKKETKAYQEKTKEYFNRDLQTESLSQVVDDEIPF